MSPIILVFDVVGSHSVRTAPKGSHGVYPITHPGIPLFADQRITAHSLAYTRNSPKVGGRTSCSGRPPVLGREVHLSIVEEATPVNSDKRYRSTVWKNGRLCQRAAGVANITFNLVLRRIVRYAVRARGIVRPSRKRFGRLTLRPADCNFQGIPCTSEIRSPSRTVLCWRQLPGLRQPFHRCR